MARTKGKPKELPKIVKSIDYNGGSICKMSDGTMKAIICISKNGIIDDFEDIVSSRSEGQSFIDSVVRQRTEKKSKRTKGIPVKSTIRKTPTGPHAGYMKNPPEDCEYQAIDKEKCYWVDVYFCAYKCEKRNKCGCAAILKGECKHKIRSDGE